MRRFARALLALLAAVAGLNAEASLTRSSSPAREAPALSLTLAAPEPSQFSLFDGTEIARALASRPAFDLISITTDDASAAVRTSFVSPSELSADELPSDAPELLPITNVREQRFNLRIPPDVFGLEPLRGPPGDEASYPRTRYRVFGLLGTPILGELRGVSLDLRWGCASFSCGLSSGTVGWLSQDPMEDRDSPNLYGFVGARPHEFTDPTGECLLLNDEPCSVTAGRIDRALDAVKGFVDRHTGSGAGSVATNALIGTVIDAGKLLLVDPLRIGEATGTAIGSGAGAGETALAIVQDVGRGASIAAGAGSVIKAAGRGAKALRGALAAEEELTEAAGNALSRFPRKTSPTGATLELRPSKGGAGPNRWQLVETPEVGGPKVHGNSLRATGPHDVYVVRDANTGQIYHFGETGRGFEVRGAEWQRVFAEDYGLDTVFEHLRTVEGKAAARALETRYIRTYEKLFGHRPGFAGAEGAFVELQKTLH